MGINTRKDAGFCKNIFCFVELLKQKAPPCLQRSGALKKRSVYLTEYITSFTSLTVRGTSGKAAFTRLPA